MICSKNVERFMRPTLSIRTDESEKVIWEHTTNTRQSTQQNKTSAIKKGAIDNALRLAPANVANSSAQSSKIAHCLWCFGYSWEALGSAENLFYETKCVQVCYERTNLDDPEMKRAIRTHFSFWDHAEGSKCLLSFRVRKRLFWSGTKRRGSL